jgi:hypothetical protein
MLRYDALAEHLSFYYYKWIVLTCQIFKTKNQIKKKQLKKNLRLMCDWLKVKIKEEADAVIESWALLWKDKKQNGIDLFVKYSINSDFYLQSITHKPEIFF